MDARYGHPDELYSSLRHLSGEDDPPDVIAFDYQGNSTGFEVTEFVDGPTIDLWKKDKSDETKAYEESEFRAIISSRILKKASKPFRKECSTRILIIYSDESVFISSYKSAFPFRFPPVTQTFFDEIWFLIPPAVNPDGDKSIAQHPRTYKIY